MEKIRKRAIIQLIIIVITGIFVNFWSDSEMMLLSIPALFLTLGLFFCLTLIKVYRQKRIEEAAYAANLFDETTTVCVTTVCKNEGETIIEAVKHYLRFSENVHFVLYDDHSTDGSFEKLEGLTEGYGGRFVLKRLKKKAFQIHPKAFAIEDAFNHVECDYFLVIDSDTRITKKDFNHAISAMNGRKTDVLHITRRNDLKACLPCKMADKEELMNMGLQLLKLQPANFPGSGYFVRSKIVKGFHYDQESLSEDNYFLKTIKKKTDRIDFFLTLSASERAPETFGDFLKQRFNWLKMGFPYYLTQELPLLTLGNILFTLIFSALFNPVSPGIALVAIVVGIITGMQLAFSVVLTRENPLKTVGHTVCYLLTIGYFVGFVYFYLQIMTALGRANFVIQKNCQKKKEEEISAL